MKTHDTEPRDAAQLTPGDLLTEGQAAELLRCAKQTLRNWRCQGKGIGPRYRKIGARLIRYHRADLQAFVDGEERAA